MIRAFPLVALLALTGVAHADECDQHIRITGTILRASAACNDMSMLNKAGKDWLIDDACKARANSEKGIETVSFGMDTFDVMAEETGLKSACKAVREMKFK